MDKINKTEDEWREQLSEEVYRIARQAGTERAFTGKYCDTKTRGTYQCACCQAPLFSSDAKFDSGTGWPSFWVPIQEHAVSTNTDSTHGMERTEALCRCCDAHLGHVFEDGPDPTGLRYCLNSASLHLVDDQTGEPPEDAAE